MRTNKSTRSKKKSPRWEPPVVPAVVLGGAGARPMAEPRMVTITVTDVPDPRPAVAAAARSEAAPSSPADAESLDPWSRPETMPARSANLVMLWLLIPLVAVVLYGLLVR